VPPHDQVGGSSAPERADGKPMESGHEQPAGKPMESGHEHPAGKLAMPE